jgi:hypothetical protein
MRCHDPQFCQSSTPLLDQQAGHHNGRRAVFPSNLPASSHERKFILNKGLTAGSEKRYEHKKRAAKHGGSQESNREASNKVAKPLGKNPENWMINL